MAKSKAQIIQEIIEKYPPVNPKTPGVIVPNEVRARNKAMKKAGIFEYIDENGHRVRWDQHGEGQAGKWQNTESRNATRRLEDPYTGKRGTRRDATIRYTNKRQRNLKASTPELQKEVDAIYAERDRLNAGKALDDPTRYEVEHRIQQHAWREYGLPGNPHDPHNLWLTTAEEAVKKSQVEQNLRANKYKGKYIVDFNPDTHSFHITPRSEFKVGQEAIGGFEIPQSQWSSPDYDSKKVLSQLESYAFEHREAKGFTELMETAKLEQKLRGKVPLSIQNETVEAALDIKDQARLEADNLLANFSDVQRGLASPNERHLRNTINNKLNTVYTTDPSSELYSMGLWHDGETLDDSWVKITRELNTDSGTFANGKWTPSIDPTARTNIDILSDIGQGEGEFSDIVALKNKFHKLKRTLPPGEYYMHADNLTKAKYYQRAFRNDPWIGPSGEQGGMRMPDGTFKKYDTLKLTVPDVDTQFTQAEQGPYPRWQDQGVPQSTLSKATPDGNPLNSAAEIARRNEATLLADRPTLRAAAEASGGLKNALRKAGTVLPFVGAGLDAWDVQQRWDEAMNNPNEGFGDFLDKAQLGIASATLGTSFWAEPANFALGVTNLGIDAARTVFEEDKRKDFLKNMRAIGRGTTYAAQQLL